MRLVLTQAFDTATFEEVRNAIYSAHDPAGLSEISDVLEDVKG